VVLPETRLRVIGRRAADRGLRGAVEVDAVSWCCRASRCPVTSVPILLPWTKSWLPPVMETPLLPLQEMRFPWPMPPPTVTFDALDERHAVGDVAELRGAGDICADGVRPDGASPEALIVASTPAFLLPEMRLRRFRALPAVADGAADDVVRRIDEDAELLIDARGGVPVTFVPMRCCGHGARGPGAGDGDA